MIRAIRPNAMAEDDASMISGWNVAPNIAYILVLLPGSASCGVLLYDETGSTLIATGASLVGTAQPCVLLPQTGQTVGMVDADLGWHLLLTTAGTESQRTIRLGPAVDLPDEIHPVYGDDALSLARATAAIDAAAHYIDDITVTCPLGLGAALGDVVSLPVDGVAVVGQVESITWTATSNGAIETAVIRRHVAIAPEPVVEVTPTVADDAGTATHATGTSGNVLTNDDTGLTITAVNGLSGNVGAAVDGDNGGAFTINAHGAWTFSPDGDFALLEGAETADTSVTYHASDGTAEAMATLTVTVSRANTAPVAVNDTAETDAATVTSDNVLANDTDADGDTLTVSQVAGSAGNVGVAVAGSSGGLFTVGSDGAWTFDPNSDFDSLTGEETATTSVSYHVSDGMAEDVGTLTVTVSAAVAVITGPWDPADKSAMITLSNYDKTVDMSGSGTYGTIRSVGPATTKVYAEIYIDNAQSSWYSFFGLASLDLSVDSPLGINSDGWGYYQETGTKRHANSYSAFGETWQTGDVIGIAYDPAAGKVWWAKNGVWQGGGDPANGVNPAFAGLPSGLYLALSVWHPDAQITGRFALEEFSFAPPTGFAAWS